MFLEADLAQGGEPFAPDPKTRLDLEKPDRKVPEKKPPTSQELTLSYLCDNPHRLQPAPTATDKDDHPAPPASMSLLEALVSSSSRCALKGKEVSATEETPHDDRRWVERDFLQLSGSSGQQSKREAPEGDAAEDGAEDRGKKAKVETLSLSLGLPNLSLSLSSSNPPAAAVAAAAAQVAAPAAGLDPPSKIAVKRTQSINTHNTRASSDDFTASRSYSYYSLPFSHNPSCSLTRNSTENYDYSRENDHIWCAGEGTNGSVHSRFKPIGGGDAIAANNISFSNHHGHPRQPSNGKEVNHSIYRANSSENCSLFPSELPARQRENGLTASEGGRHGGLSRPERVLRDMVTESVSAAAQLLQDVPSDSIEAVKEYLRNVMSAPEKREEFGSLRRRLERRSDLTHETLLKAHRTQLDILVAIRTGLTNFLSGKNRLPTTELVEIFLLSRCKNVNCKSVLPVDDCDCKICSTKKGFCSACMCPICLSFDCALNTCSWVGCDVCSHWCHAVCGIQKNLIRAGPCLGGDGGTTEMQFYCLGCEHASEMFGFVKEVFNFCAKDWGLETLTKELDCVRKIFRGSEDIRGKELHSKAEEMLSMLNKKLISPVDACNNMVQFLKYGVSELSTSARVSKDKGIAQWSQREDINVRSLPPSATTATYNLNSSGVCRDALKDIKKVDIKAAESEPSFITSKKDGFESLESIVRFKEAEANLFQRLADDARREVEGYRQIARAKTEKLEEEYATKLAKLCLQETEERRRKKLEEMKILENSNYDYYKMKMRMQAEIASLLERMEATKQQWV